jgi:CopA family copper-resistance protein
MPDKLISLTRRKFVTGAAAGGLAWRFGIPASLANGDTSYQPVYLRGNQFDLTVGYQNVNFTGVPRVATTVNGSLPSPTLVWKEGDRVTLRVKNTLSEDSSIHWHGIILPANMDGVPGMSFAGIKPGETFEYSFDVNQSGTYWYHSHSGFQEQTGMYGAIIVEPRNGKVDDYDREHVVVLSDWSDENPEEVYRKLKILPHYFNTNERTLNDLYRDIKSRGVRATWKERRMWNQMRMSDRDVSDVTGWTYTFLMNGNTPDQGWTGLFRNGEKVKLRFINAAAMTIFDVRIPGLKMTVVASDGQDIEPVSIDEFRIGVAETYDVIVEPDGDTAYTVFAQAIDRSGYARGTLTTDVSLQARIPDMDPVPILGHGDMGMAHGDHSGHKDEKTSKSAADQHMHHKHHQGHSGMNHSGMDHSMHMNHQRPGMGSGKAGFGSASDIRHAESEFGPHVDMRAEMPRYQLDDPGIGLRDHQQLYGRKVLTYADIKNRYRTLDERQPDREIELHLTGNMSRYMWSVNGIKFADADPLQLSYGERVRITLVNDTMMNHPIHLHGMWSELETGDANYIPRKHTVIVQPGAKISYLVTADAKGRWAYHCHLLYHMLGMFREVVVS